LTDEIAKAIGNAEMPDFMEDKIYVDLRTEYYSGLRYYLSLLKVFVIFGTFLSILDLTHL